MSEQPHEQIIEAGNIEKSAPQSPWQRGISSEFGMPPLLSLDRLHNLPRQVKLIEDPDAWLIARGNAYNEKNSKIWADLTGEGGLTRQHVELIYGALMRKAVRPGIRILDAGCGTGHMVLHLAGTIGNEGEAHGIDISKFQLEKAGATAKRQGRNNVHFVQGTPSDGIPYPDGHFDVLFSHIAYQLMPRKYYCLQEMFRVLKPGGLLALVTSCETSWSHIMSTPEAWCMIFDYVEKHPHETEGKVHYPIGMFPTLELMNRWLTEIGYEDIELAQHNPFHRVPPMFNRAYWSVWIDESVLTPIAAYVQDLASQIMPQLGVMEPRLDVFARKPLADARRAGLDQAHAALDQSWVKSSSIL
jgi:ubiquinone/menaquinone biosynthesis C-methylase UbiE